MKNEWLTDRWGAFIASCKDPLSALDNVPRPPTSITLLNSRGEMTGIACSRRRYKLEPDQRGHLQRFIGTIINLRTYGTVRHPESRCWD